MNTIQRTIISLTLAAASIGAAYAADPAGATADYGQPVTDGVGVQRVINIDSNTRYVNVQDGETVQFKIAGISFSWHFDTYPNKSVFALQRIVPDSIQAGSVQVYVAPNPLYRN